MLCEKIVLDRISQSDYIHFIDKIANKRWGDVPEKPFYQALFVAAGCHPYTINLN